MAITLGRVIPRWLRKISTDIGEKARRKSVGKKSGIAQGKPRISVVSFAKKAVISATNFHAGRPAFDGEIKVPLGGFAPTAANARALGVRPGGGLQRQGNHWIFVKPEGRIVRRARVYSRFSGQTIKKEGFLSEATREVMVGPVGKRNLQLLAIGLTQRLAVEIANELVKDLNANGIVASATTGIF